MDVWLRELSGLEMDELGCVVGEKGKVSVCCFPFIFPLFPFPLCLLSVLAKFPRPASAF